MKGPTGTKTSPITEIGPLLVSVKVFVFEKPMITSPKLISFVGVIETKEGKAGKERIELDSALFMEPRKATAFTVVVLFTTKGAV